MEGQSYTFLSKQFFTFSTMKSSSVLIHFPKSVSATEHLEDLGLENKVNDDELDVIVDDVPYKVIDGIYQDPDEQLCEHYGIDYNQVNCIEAVY